MSFESLVVAALVFTCLMPAAASVASGKVPAPYWAVPTAEPSKYSHGRGMGAGHLEEKRAFNLSLGLGAFDECQAGRQG